jgi:DNA-binding NarL/FixJ family response regulator
VAVRCLIVDDNRRFLRAAKTLLEREGLDISGVATTSAEALRQAATLLPDVVLVDVALGEESGLELARRLDADHADAVVILISTRSETDLADAIALSPAAGFLAKSQLSAEAIRGLVNDASARRGRWRPRARGGDRPAPPASAAFGGCCAAGGRDVIMVRDGERDVVQCGSERDTVLADRRDVVARDCERVSRR